IGGEGLALGYWNDPEQTRARFIVHPETGQRLYDTGDLGRYRPDGSIEFLGREDHQIKLRGFRIELGEIEAAILSHPHIQNAVAVLAASGQTKRIVAYVMLKHEARQGIASEDDQRAFQAEMRAYLEARIPDYMVPSTCVLLDALPLTANGKLDRKALPAADTSPPETRIAPRSVEEVILCALVSDLLGIELERVGLGDNFFHLGGDSIDAVRLANRARERGLFFAAADVFLRPVLDDLLRHRPAPAREAANAERPEREFYPLTEIAALRARHPNLEHVWPPTPLQEGLWFHGQFDRAGEDPYLVQLVFELEGALDPTRLRAAFDHLLDRHPSLRISFQRDRDDRPVQLVHKDVR